MPRLLAVLRSLVDVRRGERLVALLMFSYLFLIISTFAIVKPVRSSLFLEQFGARNLPYIYLATALVAGGVAWIHSRLLDRFNIVTVQALTHLFFISNLLLFWVAFRSDSPWLSAAFFLWVNTFTITANTLFWMFANSYYNPREAKRLYGIINAGGTVGGLASGLAVAAVVGQVGTENMLLICSALLGVAILLVYLTRAVGRDRFTRTETPYVEAVSDPRQPIRAEPRSVGALFQSPYPRYIAAALGLSLVISTLIDYQFNLVVEQTYATRDAKTAFFSSFMAGVNAFSFVLQFFLTGQLLRRLGIGFALLLLPVTLFGGTFWMALQPGLAAVLFLKVADGSVRYSVEQSTRDILYLPIPNQVMGKLKSFVDVFVQRVAKGLGSLLILALTVWWTIAFGVLNYVSLILAALWVTCAVLLRKGYRTQLRAFVAAEHPPTERKFVRVLDQTSTTELLKALEEGQEEKTLFVLDLLEAAPSPEVAAALRTLVQQGSPRLQAKALHLLAERGDATLIAEAQQILRHEGSEARHEAIHYLCAGSPSGAAAKMQEFLTASDLPVRASALACVVNCGGSEGERMGRTLIEGLLVDGSERAVTSRKLVAMSLGHIRPPSALHAHLQPLLQDSSRQVVEEALVSAKHVLRRDHIPLIVDKLAHPQLAPVALGALKAHGARILGTLRDYLVDDTVSVDIRGRLASVFVEVGTERAAQDLASVLTRADGVIRFEILKALNKVKDRHAGLQVNRNEVEELLNQEIHEAYRLLAALHARVDSVTPVDSLGGAAATLDDLTRAHAAAIDRIFRLLGLLFDQQEIYTTFVGLHSQRKALKANALELLDALLPGRLHKILLPLVDDEIPIAERLRVGASLRAADSVVSGL